MAARPLSIQFSDSVATIWCDDHTLYQLLFRYFRHCLGYNAPTVATYHITTTKDHQWQLLRVESPGPVLSKSEGSEAYKADRADTLLYRGSSRPFIIERLLQDTAMTLTAHCQKALVFHAASLAYQARGLIICGESGSGKSTLATWLTASGFEYLTDELVALTFDQDDMHGLARPPVLKSGSTFVWRHWLAETAQRDLCYLSNGTVLLDPESLRPNCVRASARPQLLLFARYSVDTSFEATQLSSAEAAFHLMRYLINAKNLPGYGFTMVAQLAQKIPAYSLIYADITKLAVWLEQIIS